MHPKAKASPLTVAVGLISRKLSFSFVDDQDLYWNRNRTGLSYVKEINTVDWQSNPLSLQSTLNLKKGGRKDFMPSLYFRAPNCTPATESYKSN